MSEDHNSTAPWDEQPLVIKPSKPRLATTDGKRVLPQKVDLSDEGFQHALRQWREFAHRRGLVVASPVRLVGAERTFLGDSDDESFGPRDYRLERSIPLSGGDPTWTVRGLSLSKKELELLSGIGSRLEDYSTFDIKDVRAPSTARVDPPEDERGRWEIMATDSQRIGTVVRTGEGSKKRYLLYLWDGGWHLVRGQPPYDLPVFGLPDLRKGADAGRPVLIHEGPKAWWGAKSRTLNSTVGRLSSWLSLFDHIGWHGADVGMAWTDWSPLRGRNVVIWPDMDEAGIHNARTLARTLARMGGVIEVVEWGAEDIIRSERWDWGDDVTPFVASLTVSAIRERRVKHESPIDASGRLLPSFVKRSVFDPERKELYIASRAYRPIPLENFVYGLPKGLGAAIANSTITRYEAITYEPGRPHGPLSGGIVNLATPGKRDAISASPLRRKLLKRFYRRWIRHMVPDLRERKHLIRRIAWALARPHLIPQHMIVLMGDSGIGKSVLLDLIVRLAGKDRAISVPPDTVMNKFNGMIASKSIVCIPEIHSNDITRRQNASRLKDLVANETIVFEEKNRPRVSVKNVIHWFAATNEKIPFSLEHRNDRFYFIQCRAIPNGRAYFRKWIPPLHREALLDEIFAAAKYLVDKMPEHYQADMVGRARPQKIWSRMEGESLEPWKRYTKDLLAELYAPRTKDNGELEPVTQPISFLGNRVAAVVSKKFPRVVKSDVIKFLVDCGFTTPKYPNGFPYKKRYGGLPETIWCRKEHAPALESMKVIALKPRLLAEAEG